MPPAIEQPLAQERLRITAPFFTIAAGQNKVWFFTLKRPGRLVGAFQTNLDVIVEVDNAETYAVIPYSANTPRTFYSSGRVGFGTLNLNLPAGYYALVFNNTYSIFTSKHLKTEIYAEQ